MSAIHRFHCSSFQEGQFLIPDYGTDMVDQNCHEGDIMSFLREDIHSKLLSVENLPIEGFYFELNLQKQNGHFVGPVIQIL